MMMVDSSLLSIPVPNIISSSPSGGRFDFDDGGTYCGGWQDGKAHGHGVCTGPKNVGEYSGSWNFGFEMSGVYKWKNGAVYEGRWQNGKRHGVGVEYNGKWIYKGEWSQGFKGRYGVKMSSNSAVKYEGTWANGLQDGYGSETYSDGGYYQGQMCRGLRHGYGVRKSAPYGDSQLNNPTKNGQQQLVGASSMLIHSNSLQSTGSVDLDDDSPKPEDGFKPNIDRTLASKNGFVLVAKPLDVPIPSSISSPSPTPSGSKHQNAGHSNNDRPSGRRNSLTGGKLSGGSRIPSSSGSPMSLFRGLRLKKQKSTSDLESLSALARGGGGISSRSTGGNVSIADDSGLPSIPFSLSPEELDITDPTTVETYTGEWKHDKRNGHGVCERSDGLKYEGQWHNDMKCGYGVTTFKNKTKEEGKYKNNILIADSKVKRFFHLGGSNMRQRIDEAVKMAQQAQTMALKKAEIADTRAATARDKADQATTAALEADRDSQIAFSVANQYRFESLQQQQQQVGLQMGLSIQQPPGGQMMADVGPLLNAAHMLPADANSSLGAPAFGASQSMAEQSSGLSMGQSSLQMRRISQNQARFGPGSQPMNLLSNMEPEQHPFNQVGQPNQQQPPGGVHLEPFNGRRGSFRGTAGNSSGYQSAFASRNQANSSNFNAASAARAKLHYQNSTSTSDPFNDLFDHYKSSTASIGHSMRRMPGKQASLDYQPPPGANNRASVPRHFGAGQEAAERMQRFRISSMDHADELGGRVLANEPSVGGQPFKYLITSGEELLQARDQAEFGAESSQQQQPSRPTPTGSSSYLQSPAGSSSLGATQTSPSPDNHSGSFHLNRSLANQQQPFYAKQQAQRAQAAAMMAAYPNEPFVGSGQFPLNAGMRQRDVQSLADEQLYMATGRAFEMQQQQQQQQQQNQRTAYTRYDFTISEAPRLSRRCLRRTNSLSRNTPIRSHSGIRCSSASSSATQLPGSRAGSRNRLLDSNQDLNTSNSPSKIQSGAEGLPSRLSPNNPIPNMNLNHNLSLNQNLTQAHKQDQDASSHLTLSSASSSILRKPSLQVRYDLLDLGGLMSREEVAALSHAQREQKRLEAEMAEKRAKQPFLHLCLSLKEFAARQKLLLCVLLVNLILLKTFADLIV